MPLRSWSPHATINVLEVHFLNMLQVLPSAARHLKLDPIPPTGTELGQLTGHPEEVYAVHFLPGGSNGGSNDSNDGSLLLSGSGNALYLWDLNAGQLLQQSCPLPFMQGGLELRTAAMATGSNGGSNGLRGTSGSSSRQQPAAAAAVQTDQQLQHSQQAQQQQQEGTAHETTVAAAAVGEALPSGDGTSNQGAAEQQQTPPGKQHGQQGGSAGMPSVTRAAGSNAAAAGAAAPDIAHDSVSGGSDADEEDNTDTDDNDVNDMLPPSYIFSVSVAEGAGWVAAACSDGMVRLWDASRRSLQEIGAVQVSHLLLTTSVTSA